MHLVTNHQSIWSKTDKTEGVDRQFYNNSWIFQYLNSIMDRKNRGNIFKVIKNLTQSNISNRHMQNTISKNEMWNILLKGTWDLFQNRLHVRPQAKSSYIIKNRYHTSIFFDHEMKLKINRSKSKKNYKIVEIK